MASGRRLRSPVRVLVGLLTVFLLATPAVAADRGGLINVIISFRGQERPTAAALTEVMRGAGGELTHRFRLINAVSATIPAGALGALRSRDDVRAVELDAQISLFHHGPATGNPELEAAWGVEHIGAGFVHSAGNTGQGIKIGVIDTGIDYTHPDLDANYAGGYDFYNNDPDPFDDHGHGTHVSGTLAAEANAVGVVGVAPDADLYAYKVLGADGSGDYSFMIAALEQAVLDGVDVVNMSLGGTVDSVALHNEVIAAYNAGIVLVAASGNVGPSGQACPVAYPAAYDEVFATTFTGPDDALTGYSCTGPQVDFAAPGDYINSTVPTGSCPLCAPSGYSNLLSGTSMASPHLAGTVALVLAHGIANSGNPATLADDVKAHLCANTAVGTGVTYFGLFHVPISPTDPRYPDWFGCGVVDANEALVVNPPSPPPPPPTNNPPLAGDDAATTTQDVPVTIDVLANDSDPDGDGLAIDSVGQPANGSASIVAGGVQYVPAPGFLGADSLTYSISDGHGGTAAAIVSVTVSLPAGPTMHVADLDNTSTLQKRAWTARVRIRVHNANHANLSGIVVTGAFSNGATRSCTTGSTGRCSVSVTGLSKTLVTSVTWTVSSLASSGRTYTPSLNHDPDADSDGTTIVVNKP